MLTELWEKIDPVIQGSLLIIFGSILLFQVLNILDVGITWILALIALAFVFEGSIKTGILARLIKLLKESTKK